MALGDKGERSKKKCVYLLGHKGRGGLCLSYHGLLVVNGFAFNWSSCLSTKAKSASSPTNLGRRRRHTNDDTRGAEERAGDVEERVVDLGGASEPS